MQIKVREVVMKVVDEISLTPMQWDTRNTGTVGWRDHMAKILNLRVTKLAPQCDALEFYNALTRFAHEIGFGEDSVITGVTEQVYGVRIMYADQQCAA